MKLMLTIFNALPLGSFMTIIGNMPVRTLIASVGVPVRELFDIIRY